jgi:hypothetical protein
MSETVSSTVIRAPRVVGLPDDGTGLGADP